jgi:hypothetical protein
MGFKNLIIKMSILILVVLAFAGVKPGFAALNDYTITTSIAESWKAGVSEYWHLSPVNEKKEFYLGEKIQFFAQSGYINVAHTWTVKIYNGEDMYKEVSLDYNPGDYGWHYSNFNPWYSDLPAGDYRAEYYLNSGNGDEHINSKEFTVLNEVPSNVNPYTFHHATTATSWAYGSDNEYWDIKPVGKKTEFNVGEDVNLMIQTRNIYFDHRYKVELYKEGSKQWEYSSDWLEVAEKWEYSNFYPSYTNTQPGNYKFKVYIDTGVGFFNIANTDFRVVGDLEEHTYRHTYLSSGWEHGDENEGAYWDIKPTGQKNVFSKGETIFALSQVKNIYRNHQWKVEVLKGDDMLWEYETPWREVGTGWTYANFLPTFSDAQPGNYRFRIYINTGDGYKLLENKAFSVEGEMDELVFDHAVTATEWEHGGDNDHWNLKPLKVSNTFNEGENVYLMAQVRNIYVDHRYRVELHNGEELMWTYDTDWQNVGAGWAYSNFFPAYYNAQAGHLEFWYYLDTGEGFELYGKKAFDVIPDGDEPIDEDLVIEDSVDEDPIVDPVVDPVTYEDYNRGVTVYNTVGRNDFEYFSENGVSTVRLMLMDGDLLEPSVDFNLASSSRTILPENIDKLNSVLALGKEYGIKVIVDVHEIPGLNRWFISEDKPKDTRMWDVAENISAGEEYRELLVTVWDQLSQLMKDRDSEAVVYELFNEPEPKTDYDPNEDKGYLWYDLQDSLIDTIRENNDTHLIVATPAYSWKTESLSDWIPSIAVLNDENIAASVHGYRPIQFTIQEEAWYGNVEYNAYPGTYDEEHYGETTWNYEMIDNLFAGTVGNFYKEYGVQVYLAEFAVNREAPGAELWLLDMMNLMNKEYSDEIWGWSVHVWEEDQYARLNHLDYDWSRAGMNDFSTDPAQLEAVLAGINNIEETLME